MKRQLILGALASQYWALEPRYLETMSSALQRWAAGQPASPEVLADVEAAQAARSARAKASGSVGGGIAVLPLYGVVSQRASMMDDICGAGGTSTERFTQAFREAMADDSVGGIIIDIDSPGGSVFGVADLYDEIMGARGVKPVYGFVNSLCASAAYWLGSACSQLIAVQGSMTGSIGVYTQHVDMSKALEMDGVSQEFISAGKYKVEGNSYGPLSDEARAFTQAQIDSYYSAFTQAVAKGRGAAIAQVRDGMGQGRCLLPVEALSAGMIDAVDTFDGVVKRLKGAIKSRGANAVADTPSMLATGALIDPTDPEMVERIANATITKLDEPAATDHKSRMAARARALQLASL
jgi:signal peptide peptidase SppA